MLIKKLVEPKNQLVFDNIEKRDINIRHAALQLRETNLQGDHERVFTKTEQCLKESERMVVSRLGLLLAGKINMFRY